MSGRLVILASGGTGGHMFPAEALASALLARGHRVALVTDRRGQAFADRLPDVALHRIPAGRLDAGLVGKAMGVAEMILGTLIAGRLLGRLQPAVAVGFGGYPSVPTMLAATRRRVATVLHEQNALMGRANRLLAPRVTRIATSFPHVQGLKAADVGRTGFTGNPVRPDIVKLRDLPYPSPSGTINVLVTGGSQGARILSTVIPDALARLPNDLKARIVLMQQARPEDVERVRGTHRQSGINAEVAPFFHDLPARLSRAHLVIARAGASTVSELCVAGRPAILVPFAAAADDHQSFNARALGDAGAAWVMPERDFTPDALAARLATLLAAPKMLATAALAARDLGMPDAASRLADLVLACANANTRANKSGESAA
ncbi:MAG TPA: undecaprenyldiphospho-muramoylpentapeptide beta-N-acetylglucosaminyltransferase [Stellaceae bacterium]|jgi:UDP-N-acetylglucosamine--N-acetylmuramyl-(pentapeptide) pyrophosphoryl-undecaprenol N-acetylglucosamine transferase|nr:undecaprenyldiphospho-muramoylpentapeptide beta-N-acetylglucosaminyltransferase [Stellaceae bacterium]